MISRDRIFYAVLTGMVLLNSYLLSKPNLLGKIGLLILKYSYLCSFPRTLLTVSIIVSVALVMCWLIEFFVVRNKLPKKAGIAILLVMTILSLLLLYQTKQEFKAWSLSHIGAKFRYGAYMLPSLLAVIFTYFIVDINLSVSSADSSKELAAENQSATNADR